MITRAKFRNFKALRDVEITFDSRLTVLVGPNGSGKTSILQGLLFLCQAAEFGPTEGTEFNVGQLGSFISRNAGVADLHLHAESATGGDDTLEVQICPVIEDFGRGRQFRGYGTEVSGVSSGTKRWTKSGQPVPPQVKAFRGAVLLRLDAGMLAAPSLPEEVPPRLRPSGKGLASVLAYLRLNRPERFDAVVDSFRKVITSVDRVRFDKVQTQGFADTLLFDFTGASDVPSAHVSTGTLHALGLITSILGTEGPRVLLLDDLDHGLHPKAQLDLVDALRNLLQQNPELQIIATSHSPYILDKLKWNEVRVTSLLGNGSALCKPLSDHPLHDKWKDAMTPGEFWSHAGEEWVKGDEPVEAVSP